MFLIPIRNKDTGEEKNFFGPQDIADFLATRDDAAAWTGWEFLGALPVATVAQVEAAPEPEPEPQAEPVAETPIEPAPEVPPEPVAPEAPIAEPVETLLHRIEEAVEHIVHPDASA